MKINRNVTHRNITRWLLLGLILTSFSVASYAQIAVGISVRIGPPALPVYAQPICPGAGYIWTPGYWAWNDDGGYYWVPGTWVVAPVGLLWTPGYWGWAGGVYLWHAGYWGPHIGFYGGVNYGFGYGGVGFVGGEWRGGTFFYNRSVTNISVTNVTNVYNKTVVVNENHVAFNGGEGGVTARPTPAEEAAEHEQHTPVLASQTQHEQMASQNKQNFASENHGRPAVAATSKAGDFSSHSAVSARSAGGEYHAPAMSPKEARASVPQTGAEKTSADNRGNSNEGFRSFTPPSKNENQAQNKSESQNESRSASRGRSQSQAESKPESQPKESAPKPNSHKSSPPQKNNKPSEPKEHGKGR